MAPKRKAPSASAAKRRDRLPSVAAMVNSGLTPEQKKAIRLAAEAKKRQKELERAGDDASDDDAGEDDAGEDEAARKDDARATGDGRGRRRRARATMRAERRGGGARDPARDGARERRARRDPRPRRRTRPRRRLTTTTIAI